MARNKELLRQTLEHIKANPQDWEQWTWRCETGMCYAGHAGMKAGFKWAPDELMYNGTLALSRNFLDKNGAEIYAPTLAARELGLDEVESDILFWESNTLEDLEFYVEHLLNNDEPLTYEIADARHDEVEAQEPVEAEAEGELFTAVGVPIEYNFTNALNYDDDLTADEESN